VDARPVIRYSSVRYRIYIGLGAIVGISLCVYGLARADLTSAVAGFSIVVFTAVLLHSVRDRLRSGGMALGREGDVLVGGELKRPFPANDTEFEVVKGWEGGWAVVLHHGEASVRLPGDGGGWAIEGEHAASRKAVERALLEMGLSRRP
jgi:hypothetical protein